jgi:hypothetical protein
MTMHRDDDRHLWDLLGSAAQPEVSPFFARNVLRRVREDFDQERPSRVWLSWRRLLPASGALAVITAFFIAYTSSFPPAPSAENDVVAKIDAQDYEVVADLDNLLASDESNLWEDNLSL